MSVVLRVTPHSFATLGLSNGARTPSSWGDQSRPICSKRPGPGSADLAHEPLPHRRQDLGVDGLPDLLLEARERRRSGLPAQGVRQVRDEVRLHRPAGELGDDGEVGRVDLEVLLAGDGEDRYVDLGEVVGRVVGEELAEPFGIHPREVHPGHVGRRRGTFERTYRVTPGRLQVDGDAAAAMTPEEHNQAFVAFMTGRLADFERYLSRGEVDLLRDRVGYRMNAMYLSDEETDELVEELRRVLLPRVENKPGPGRRRRTFSTILMPADES